MIYDYILSTGDTTISGCHSADLGTDRLNLIKKNTAKSTSTFNFDSSLVGGDSFLQNRRYLRKPQYKQILPARRSFR